MRKLSNLLVFLILFAGITVKSQIITHDSTLSYMKSAFEKKKKPAAGRSAELFSVFDSNMSVSENQLLTFLYAYMPLSDLADYNGRFFLDNVRMAIKAKNQTSWGPKVPEDVFLHFVLPVRVNNEHLDSFRISMYGEIMARVKGMTMKQAALEINHWCHEKVTYRPSDERTSSPLSSMRYSFGRCGEESTFAVAALRTAGIPARQVYTPRWAHTDDNHAWVEVWVDGKWYFMGACEPEPDLNMGWFALPSTRTMLVHTRAYGHYNGTEPILENNENFAELNLIKNYAPAKTFVVRVTDKNEVPVENAKVEYQLYNYAEFFPLAKTFTDKNGITKMTSGLGDLLIWANKGDDFAYKKITVAKTDTLKLIIENKIVMNVTEQFDIVPPVEGKIVKAGDNGRIENNRRLRIEDSLRGIYMSTFKDSVWSRNLALKLNIDVKSTISFINRSYGNWKEISSFLEMANTAQRPLAMRMLATLTDKDLRDAKAVVLYDHLSSGFLNESEFEGVKGLYDNYILSPRISTEIISPWRSFLQNQFGEKLARESRKNILFVTEYIKNNIRIDDKANAHSRTPLSPRGVYELKIADKTSRNIFFVAMCRSFCIPARINPETRIPQYFSGKEWIDNDFEQVATEPVSKAFLHFTTSDTVNMPKYYTNFTIGYFKGGTYRTLEFEEGRPLNGFPDSIEAAAGDYMLVTGNRLHDGSVLADISFIHAGEGEYINIPVEIRKDAKEFKTLAKLAPENYIMKSIADNKEINLKDLLKSKPYVIIFLDEKEPSKHIINDLVLVKQQFEASSAQLLFVLPKYISETVFNTETLKNIPGNHVFLKQVQGDLLSSIEKQTCSLLTDKLPVILVFDKENNLVYLNKGYTIGIGEQLLNILRNH